MTGRRHRNIGPQPAARDHGSKRSGATAFAITGTILWVLAGLAATEPADALPKPRDTWREVRTENFVVMGNASQRTLKRTATDLEYLRAALDRLTTFEVESSVPNWVWVFEDDDAFEPYMPLEADGSIRRVGGTFACGEMFNLMTVNGDPRIPSKEIVYHEFTHFFLDNNLWYLPPWLNEGWSEYYSTFEVFDDHVNVGRPIQNNLRQMLSGERLEPLERILTAPRSAFHGNLQYYAQSWGFVHYLLAGNDERRPQFFRYLNLLGAGTDHADAFQQAFGTTYEDFLPELRHYLRKPALPYRSYELPRATPPELEIAELSYPETLYRLAELLLHMGPDREAEAREHLEKALEVEPGHARALAALATLTDDAEETATLFGRAGEAAPTDPIVQFRRAKNLSKSQRHDEAVDALRVVTKAHDKNVRAWALYAFTLLHTEGDQASDELIAAAKRSHELLPGDPAIAGYLMEAYRRAGRYDDARQLAIDFYMKLPAESAARSSGLRSLAWTGIEAARTLADADRAGEALAVLDRVQNDLGGAKGRVEEDLADSMKSIEQIRIGIRQDRCMAALDDAAQLVSQDQYAVAKGLVESALSMDPTENCKLQAERMLGQIEKLMK